MSSYFSQPRSGWPLFRSATPAVTPSAPSSRASAPASVLSPPAHADADASSTHVICTICCGPLSSPLALPCAHTFCAPCVARWLHAAVGGASSTCPLCRLAVPPPTPGAVGSSVQAAVAEAAEAAAREAQVRTLWRWGEPAAHWLYERPGEEGDAEGAPPEKPPR